MTKLVDEILSRTEDLNCEVDVSASSMDMSALGAAGSVWRSRKRSDRLQTLAAEVAGLVEQVPGTAEVSDGLEESAEEERIVVNKEKASKYNLTVAQVFQQISAKLAESKAATTITTDTKDYDGCHRRRTRRHIREVTVKIQSDVYGQKTVKSRKWRSRKLWTL